VAGKSFREGNAKLGASLLVKVTTREKGWEKGHKEGPSQDSSGNPLLNWDREGGHPPGGCSGRLGSAGEKR